MSQQTRVHNRPVERGVARSKLREITASMQRRADTKVGTLPEGGYAAIVRCVVRDKKGVLKLEHRIFGTTGMREALEHAAPGILAQHGITAVTTAAAAATADDAELAERYSMPGDAEGRASKLRVLLREAWGIHAAGTKFAASKHIYEAVNTHGAHIFPWWNAVTDTAPFMPKTVDDSGISRKIFEYLAPRLLERAMHETPGYNDAPPPAPGPHVQCPKNLDCIRSGLHRGKCTLRGNPNPDDNRGYKPQTVKEPKKRRRVDDDEDDDARPVRLTGRHVPTGRATRARKTTQKRMADGGFV